MMQNKYKPNNDGFFLIKIVVILITCLYTQTSIGQIISVTSFSQAENDLTANRPSTLVLDQNNEKCALIRVQTTQKGFTFDVGSMGIQKVDDTHDGEIWVYVPFGVKHISIRHAQLGSLPIYNFPISIKKAKTYIMVISSDKVFVNKYDDTHKQKLLIKVKPIKSIFLLNGLNVDLDIVGQAEQVLSFGTYTYKVESEGFYPKEGQITINDSTKMQQLEVYDMKPIMGKLRLYVEPNTADVKIDDIQQTRLSLADPIDLQIGRHTVVVTCDGYKNKIENVSIEEDKTAEMQITLEQEAEFQFQTPSKGAKITVDDKYIGVTPCSEKFKTGIYKITATRVGFKDFSKRMVLNCSDPNVKIPMRKILNGKNEIYVEGSCRVGSFLAYGGTIGAYFLNFNLEGSYLVSGNSEQIYWNYYVSDTGIRQPEKDTYNPSTTISGKIGYGLPIGSRCRITPQIGFNSLTINENTNYVLSGLISLRFSYAIAKVFALSLSPEYSFAMSKSKTYKLLSEPSTKIKKWGEGFNLKFGTTLFFQL